MRIRIAGRMWCIDFVRYVGGNRKGNRKGDMGECGCPDITPRKIKLRDDLRGQRLMDVVIHEVLHASNWTLDEEFVAHFATDVARVLRHPDIWSRVTEGKDAK